MSILIKGMKMPSCCEECPLMHEGYLYGKFFPCVCNATDGKMLIKPSEADMRDGLCPLVEIPEPHGRLIDASYKVDMPFYDDEYEEYSVRTVTVEELLMMADNEVPTVIEAEGRKDGEKNEKN